MIIILDVWVGRGRSEGDEGMDVWVCRSVMKTHDADGMSDT